jgi:hypothetical protein
VVDSDGYGATCCKTEKRGGITREPKGKKWAWGAARAAHQRKKGGRGDRAAEVDDGSMQILCAAAPGRGLRAAAAPRRGGFRAAAVALQRGVAPAVGAQAWLGSSEIETGAWSGWDAGNHMYRLNNLQR